MKREFPPLYLAALLALGCIIFRLVSGAFPEAMPNVSPLLAIALVGAMYLPARWGWLVGPAVLIVTDLAFLPLNYLTDHSGSMLSWWTALSLALYAAIGGLGLLIARRKSLTRIITGTLTASLLFYVISNTFSWAHDLAIGMPGYTPTLAGWWQSNTTGIAGYEPTWHFLRNAMAGDLVFVLLLVLMLDRELLFGQAPARSVTRSA